MTATTKPGAQTRTCNRWVAEAKIRLAAWIAAHPDDWKRRMEPFVRAAKERHAPPTLKAKVARRAERILLQSSTPPRVSPYYVELWRVLQELARELNAAERAEALAPDIDQYTPYVLFPGWSVYLGGTGFGDAPGAVRMTVSDAAGAPNDIDLDVVSWSQTSIQATVPASLTAVRPRPIASLWIVDASGNVSTGDAHVDFEPRRDTWASHGAFEFLPDCVLGICGGLKWDGLIGNGGVQDGDFDMLRVQRDHHGGGWSELREPFASAKSYAQGLHVGLAGWDTCSIDVFYFLEGPRGIAPPPPPDGYSAWTIVP